MNAPALSIRDLTVDFPVPGGSVSAVDRVSLDLHPGRIVGLVGESGCGKSTLANSVLGLLPSQAKSGGSVLLAGEEIMGSDEESLRQLRGDRMSMIFQDPSTSLDPTFSVGEQVAETIRAHRRITRRAARARAVEIMTAVGIPDAGRRYSDPPHRFSGGMRQRIVIAAALANDPAVLIADEPTTALDVTIQAQILRLIAALCRDHNTAVLLITHDLGVVAQVCDEVGVMYAGQLVEQAPVDRLFDAPQHPYTQALLAALPSGDAEPGHLHVIPGQVPELSGDLPGCRFMDRCSRARSECTTRPEPIAIGATTVSCWDVAASAPDRSAVTS
jgi:oligopeptide/dipeptide ABC transporter ATP-binding protein